MLNVAYLMIIVLIWTTFQFSLKILNLHQSHNHTIRDHQEMVSYLYQATTRLDLIENQLFTQQLLHVITSKTN